jgi:hypothetical protein
VSGHFRGRLRVDVRGQVRVDVRADVRADVRIVSTRADVARLSRAHPEALIVAPGQGCVARFGRVALAAPDGVRMALALAARPGAIVSATEMTDLLWGDRADGGPEARRSLDAAWSMAKAIFAALGYGSRREHGRGFSAWPIGPDGQNRAGDQAFISGSGCDRQGRQGKPHDEAGREEADGRRGRRHLGLLPGTAAKADGDEPLSAGQAARHERAAL